MLAFLACVASASLGTAFATSTADRVESLPGYGAVNGTQYAGLLPINTTYDKHLFYWFVEALSGNVPGKTPFLIWMNGGPGASSLTGLLVENIGPVAIKLSDDVSPKAILKDNHLTWAKKYNVIAIDNPVGSGFSYTKKGGWVTTEEEMRREYYAGLSAFFDLHPEYRTNPIWVTGESYGGKYVPNVAFEIHQRGELNLQGVIIGNGMYKPLVAYPTIPEYAFNQGILDEHSYRLAREKMGECVRMIELGQNKEAKVYCENVVYWMYGATGPGAGQFYYDLGQADGDFFDHLTKAMGDWLNSEATRKALHVGDAHWVQSDEHGPVADALVADFVTDQSLHVLEDLLKVGKYRIVNYNGVRDGSLCNHVGNLQSLNDLEWSGQLRWRESFNRPFHVDGKVAGFVREYEQLSYYTLLRTGHLVPTVVPEVGLALISSIVDKQMGSARFEGSAIV
jgi:vitellogenic carboxypeptidase-like protein